MKIRSLLALAGFLSAALLAVAQDGPPLLRAGTAAPDFTAYNPDGSALKLSDLRGKVVLVDFWATWCGPCKHAMPHLERLHQKLKDQGLVVLGVCVWDQQAAFDAWQTKPEVKTTYQKVYDRGGRSPASIARSRYNVSGIPTFYLIGKDGRVVFADVGDDPETQAGLDGALKKAGFKL